VERVGVARVAATEVGTAVGKEEATVAVRAAVRVAVKGEAATAAAREEVVRVAAARVPTQKRMSFARR